MSPRRILLVFFLLGACLSFNQDVNAAPPPDLDAWLYQHPEISGQIVWEFPDVIPELAPTVGRVNSVLSPWMKKSFLGSVGDNLPSTSAPDVPAAGASSGGPACAGDSCPANPDLDFGPGLALQWYYWPQPYKQKLKSYFNQYWNWMQVSAPLYRQFQDSGFTQKPPGFDERFGHDLDPATQAAPQLLPAVFEAMITSYTHVLYDPAATIDLFLKVVAMQLVLEAGDFLEWKLGDYSKTDLALVLDGRNYFTYFPAGSVPWDIYHKPDKAGYESTGAYPAPPLVTMNFLFREGIVRDTRWDTVSQLLEWERFHLQHAMGNQQSLVGECGKEFNEVYWGVKGDHPLSSILHGTVMACPLVPAPGSNSNGYFSSERQHYTGGCGGTGGISHRLLSLINIPAERTSFTHGQMRFVVERGPFEEMLALVEPQLPPDPAIDDGVPTQFHVSQVWPPAAGNSPRAVSRAITPPSSSLFSKVSLANAYLDHNDNPYGMEGVPEIPVKQALLSDIGYQRWFSQPPGGLSDEQRSQYFGAHDKRVGLRPIQLKIAFLPPQLFRYYCLKQDAGKPHAETETYKQFFASKFTPEEMEANGFWQRFEQKMQEYGGCAGVP